MYGRTWVLHISNLFSLAFSLGCAFAPNTGSFIAFRFLGKVYREIVNFIHHIHSRLLAGFSGSAPVGIGGGSIGDLFSERDRASAMALWTLGPLIGTYFPIFIGPSFLAYPNLPGPVVGPVAGGFISQTIGVKWVFIIIASTSLCLICQPLIDCRLIPSVSHLCCCVSNWNSVTARDLCPRHSNAPRS